MTVNDKIKIWQIKGEKTSYSDEELIVALVNGTVKGDALLINADLDDAVKVKDSVYAFYLESLK